MSLYDTQADLYDLIYARKDYASEAARLRDMLNALGVADGSRVVEAAVGTGSHLVHLRAWFSMSGYDRSPQMLAIARAKAPGVPLSVGDLSRHVVSPPADAVLCLFSAIGYLLEDAEIDAAFRCMAQCVRLGGIVIVEPWLSPDHFDVGRPHIDTYASPDLQVARAVVAERDGDQSVLRFHYLVARRGEPVQHIVDAHRMRLMQPYEQLARMEAAGLEAHLEPRGFTAARGLLVGRRRAS